MYSEEERCPDRIVLFEAEINGTAVTAFDLSGRRWYHLGALFRALDFPDTNINYMPAKVGNLAHDSGEAMKYKGAWYGTTEGLSMFEEYLRENQLSLSSNTDRETARIRYLILTRWLSDVNRAQAEANDLEASCPECDGASTSQAAGEDGLWNPGDAPAPDGTVNPRPLALDMGIFDRYCDNLMARMPYLEERLPIQGDASPERKVFAVMALVVLHPNDRIERMPSDTAGIWNGEDSLGILEAVKRSLVLARMA